jgi:hypothetical protein
MVFEIQIRPARFAGLAGGVKRNLDPRAGGLICAISLN